MAIIRKITQKQCKQKKALVKKQEQKKTQDKLKNHKLHIIKQISLLKDLLHFLKNIN